MVSASYTETSASTELHSATRLNIKPYHYMYPHDKN
jgi:hypothetical protein